MKHTLHIDPTYAWPLEDDDEASEAIPTGGAIRGMFFALFLSLPFWIVAAIIITLCVL